MEIIDFAPQKTAARYFPWDYTLRLMPIGDLHVGADGFNADRLKQYVEQGLKDGCWWIGMGDYIDFMSSRNRERLANAGLFDTARTVIDEAADRLVEQTIDILKPTAGRWLGMLEGNHYHLYDDGSTSDQALCKALKAPFLGTCAAVQVRFAQKGEGYHRRMTCEIWAHHGIGSGITPAAILNRLHRAMEAFEADVYLMGHLHRLVAEKPARLYTTRAPNPRLLEKPKILAGTGSFMAGYKQGSRYANRPKGSYVEQRMLPPTALGAPIISIRPTRTDNDRHVLDLRVTQ